MKNIYLGLGLQALAILSGFASLKYLYYIGWLGILVVSVPLFIIGIIFILRADVALVYRLILAFWILIFPLASAANYFYQKQSIQNEVYLIPQNYRGIVRVSFGDANAAAASTENGAVVIKISPTGEAKANHTVKLLSHELNIERENYREYYYIDEAGNKTKLHLDRFPEKDELIVIPAVEYHSDDGKTISGREFYVGTQSEFLDFLKTK